MNYELRGVELQNDPEQTPSGIEIMYECIRVLDMILEKNRKYGDSALNPVRIFSRADTEEQIRVRLDDKLSRLRSAQLDEDEDVYADILGYLILARIARKRRKAVEP